MEVIDATVVKVEAEVEVNRGCTTREGAIMQGANDEEVLKATEEEVEVMEVVLGDGTTDLTLVSFLSLNNFYFCNLNCIGLLECPTVISFFMNTTAVLFHLTLFLLEHFV